MAVMTTLYSPEFRAASSALSPTLDKVSYTRERGPDRQVLCKRRLR